MSNFKTFMNWGKKGGIATAISVLAEGEGASLPADSLFFEEKKLNTNDGLNPIYGHRINANLSLQSKLVFDEMFFRCKHLLNESFVDISFVRNLVKPDEPDIFFPKNDLTGFFDRNDNYSKFWYNIGYIYASKTTDIVLTESSIKNSAKEVSDLMQNGVINDITYYRNRDEIQKNLFGDDVDISGLPIDLETLMHIYNNKNLLDDVDNDINYEDGWFGFGGYSATDNEEKLKSFGCNLAVINNNQTDNFITDDAYVFEMVDISNNELEQLKRYYVWYFTTLLISISSEPFSKSRSYIQIFDIYENVDSSPQEIDAIQLKATHSDKIIIINKLITKEHLSLSDARIKENIEDIPTGMLSMFDLLKPKQYFFKKIVEKEKRKHYGFVAQELEEIFPIFVSDNGQGIKSVNYLEIIPLLVLKIKDLQDQINKLKS